MFNAHVGKSVYVMQLQRWFNVFGRESFKVGGAVCLCLLMLVVVLVLVVFVDDGGVGSVGSCVTCVG